MRSMTQHQQSDASSKQTKFVLFVQSELGKRKEPDANLPPPPRLGPQPPQPSSLPPPVMRPTPAAPRPGPTGPQVPGAAPQSLPPPPVMPPRPQAPPQLPPPAQGPPQLAPPQMRPPGFPLAQPQMPPMMMGGLPRPMIPGMSMDKFAVRQAVQELRWSLQYQQAWLKAFCMEA